MTYRYTSAALNELRDALLAYESKERGLGDRFLAEVDSTIARILMAPDVLARNGRVDSIVWDFVDWGECGFQHRAWSLDCLGMYLVGGVLLVASPSDSADDDSPRG